MTSDYLKRLNVQGHHKVKEALRKWDPIGVFDLKVHARSDNTSQISRTYSKTIIAWVHFLPNVKDEPRRELARCVQDSTQQSVVSIRSS